MGNTEVPLIWLVAKIKTIKLGVRVWWTISANRGQSPESFLTRWMPCRP